MHKKLRFGLQVISTIPEQHHECSSSLLEQNEGIDSLDAATIF